MDLDGGRLLVGSLSDVYVVRAGRKGECRGRFLSLLLPIDENRQPSRIAADAEHTGHLVQVHDEDVLYSRLTRRSP